MRTQLLRSSCERATELPRALAIRPMQRCRQQQRRTFATPTEGRETIQAAPPIRFSSDRNQFAQRSEDERGAQNKQLLDRVRVIPASPSYFTATPQFTDDVLHLTTLLRKYQYLPKCAAGQAPRISWRTYDQYVAKVNEPVKKLKFARLQNLIKRLNYIHPPLVPGEVAEALLKFRKSVQPFVNESKPIVMDDWGRTRGVGRRKSSNAQCWVVEGEGEVLVNGRSLTEYFGRIHDRESAVWALKATERLDKYNIFAKVQGGGTTGQAEAVMLGVARALLGQEPALKPTLRKAGCLTRDPRRVERKKPGKLKARKMPAWVKR